MRDTLYFKDDDSRLSFLQGNYITLTNMRDKDIERVIKYHLSPINISVHTTNPELRCKMLHNRFAGDVLDKIGRFYEAGIRMNSQVVLCQGLNDEEELDRTISDLGKFIPHMESLSVEWFILAGQEFPDEAYYEGYGQLENGVGMMRLLLEEVKERLEELSGDDREKTVSIATAKLAFPTIEKLARDVEKKFPHIKVHVYCIKNEFFGEHITVSGLLTGGDIIAQLKDKELGEELLLPCNVLKADEDIFLDDISLKGLSDSLQVPVNIIQSEGRDFVDKIIAIENGGNYE